MRGRLLLAAVVVAMVAVLIWQWVRLPEQVPASRRIRECAASAVLAGPAAAS